MKPRASHPSSHRPHREGNRLREQNQVVFEVARDANKIQIRDAVEKLFNVKVDQREHARHARQGPPHGARLRQDAELEEGDRHPQRGRHDRLLRRDEELRADVMGIKSYKPTSPARRFYSVSDFKEITKGAEPEKSLLEHQTSTGGRNHHGRITSRFRGGGHKQRYRVIDWRRDKIGVPAKVATASSTTRTARRASRSSTTSTARSATSSPPTGSTWATRSSRAATPTSSPATRCRSATSRSGRRSTTSR